jgi:hypothetical protein
MGVQVITADQLNAAVGASGKLSMLDKKILKAASKRMTPTQISEHLDGIISPAAAAQRAREILSAWDWLSINEQRALILMDMIELKEILFDRVRQEGGLVETRDGEMTFTLGDPRWSANLMKLLGQMNDLITKETANVDSERQSIRHAHGMVMVRAIEMTFDSLARDLRAEFPQVPEERMRLAIESALPLAIATVDAAISEDDEGINHEAGF